MATEGYQSSGSSDITVREGSGGNPTSGPTTGNPGPATAPPRSPPVSSGVTGST
ncbi:hypothetical protein NKG94_15035 [Micromonospora sp. M12]